MTLRDNFIKVNDGYLHSLSYIKISERKFEYSFFETKFQISQNQSKLITEPSERNMNISHHIGDPDYGIGAYGGNTETIKLFKFVHQTYGMITSFTGTHYSNYWNLYIGGKKTQIKFNKYNYLIFVFYFVCLKNTCLLPRASLLMYHLDKMEAKNGQFTMNFMCSSYK